MILNGSYWSRFFWLKVSLEHGVQKVRKIFCAIIYSVRQKEENT